MQERATRLGIAVVLTSADVARFHSYSGVIWQTWCKDQCAKAAFLALLALWIASAVMIWGHVSNDFRQTLREQELALSRDPLLAPRDRRRDKDV
jgi:hypothetical protein